MSDRTRTRILVVEDDVASSRLVERVLEKSGHYELHVVTTAAAAILAAPNADIILLDHQLPDSTGLEVLSALRSQPSQPSVIMITAHGNEATAATALRLGADDYLVKDSTLPTLLAEVVERTRRNRALRDALSSAERELVRAERLAAIGEMTVTLHHEINNPLMAATASADLLLSSDTPLPPEIRDPLQDIAKALDRIRLIVRRVGTLQDAPSREYIAGTKMLDLAAAEAAPKDSGIRRGVAAIWTRGEELGRIVAMLLKKEGFTVERCSEASALTAYARRLGTALIVTEAADASTGDALAGFTPGVDRDYQFVLLVNEADDASSVGADLVLQLPIDPATFASEVLGARR